MAEAKGCPRCGLVNPPDAQRCNCGWCFLSERLPTSPLNPASTPADDRRSPQPLDLAAVLRRAKPPAIALLLVGFMNAAVVLIVILLGFVTDEMKIGPHESLVLLINLVAALFTIFGGLNLLWLDSFALVRIGSTTAMVPCISPCLIVGIPVGLWALLTATDPDVRPAFGEPKLPENGALRLVERSRA